MQERYYIVKYSGPFGYIKPWTAVRDSETFSQQFLTPSIVEGMEKKLFPELLADYGKILKIKRHRLNYAAISIQQERVWSKGWKIKTVRNYKFRMPKLSILKRGILISPHLYLAFDTQDDAIKAFSQHLCLCRNEDIILPEEMFELSAQEFEEISGFELHFKQADEGFKVGHNRYAYGESMFGELKTYGNPIRQPENA